MSSQIRCDGCGGWPDQSAAQGRRRRDLTGDFVPPLEFDWCRLCARIAFEAVAAAAVQRRSRREAEQRRPSPSGPVEATTVLDRPALPAGNGVGALLGWLPRGRDQHDRDVTAILPVRDASE